MPPPQDNVGVNMKISTPNVVFRTSRSNTSNYSGNSNGGVTNGGENNSSSSGGGGDLSITMNGPTSISLEGPVNPANANAKKTSFQITSVTVDSSASNDGVDDSGDDMDESHTEDSSTGIKNTKF
jgi:hypothetical protein